MRSIKYFFVFLLDAVSDLLSHVRRYLLTYIAFLVMNFFSIIPWEGLGFGEKSLAEILTSISIGLVSLVLVTNIILIEKSRIKVREKEKLIYAAPTYLIYTLYSTLIILVCLSFVMLFPAGRPGPMTGSISEMLIMGAKFTVVALPAIVAAVCVAMVPLASVLIDNDSANYFKVSFKMAKTAPFLIFLFGASSLLIEVPAVLVDFFIKDVSSKLALGLLYSFFDSFFIIILTKASVLNFYHLKKVTIGEAVY